MRFQEHYSGWSPWGGIQNKQNLVRGVRFVSTASHGGLMITERFANRWLTKQARALAERWGSYFCYEEDCAYAIPCIENREIFTAFAAPLLHPEQFTQESCIATIQSYYPQYWLDTGHTLTPEYQERYNLMTALEQAEKENAIDRIIDVKHCDDYIEVTTVLGYTKKVDKEKYLALWVKCSYRRPLLSWCWDFIIG
jgi:hypothetical protein